MATNTPDSDTQEAEERVLRFAVHGKPRGQPRARHVGRGQRPVSTMDAGVRWWRQAIERAAHEAVQAHGCPAWCTGAVRVDWEATFATPHAERWGQPCTAKPDRDNVDKAILDAMQKAKLFPEDQRVSAGELLKTWGKEAGLVAIVRPDIRAAVPAYGQDSAPSWLASNPL